MESRLVGDLVVVLIEVFFGRCAGFRPSACFPRMSGRYVIDTSPTFVK